MQSNAEPSPPFVRWVYLAIALLVIPVGLISRSMRAGADASDLGGFIVMYLGDTLWAVMFFFLIAACMPQLKSAALVLITLSLTWGIELSQLYHGEPLSTLRRFPPTRFLLGTQFLWSDVACLWVGTLLAWIAHAGIRWFQKVRVL